MDNTPLWSALGLWAMKEIYAIYRRRGEKNGDDITTLRVRDGIRDEQLRIVTDRIRDLETSDRAQWRYIDTANGKPNVAS